MTRWLHADVQQVHRRLWQGWIRELDLHLDATTLAELKEKAHRVAEEAEGGQFQFVFTQC